jgi:hypothetical protein
MEQVLKEIFYDSKKGFVNVVALYEKTKQLGYNYTYEDVLKWYYDQPVNQVYKKKIKVTTFNRIESHHQQTGELQADLMVISKFYTQNSHYKYLLNVIDIYSRYAWSYPLKTKTAAEVAPYIEEIFKTIPKNHYKALCFDKGPEFKGEVLNVLKKYNVLKFETDPDSINAKNTTAMIERFNYTLWMKIKKYMYAFNTLRFIDALDDLVYNYNHTKHTMIKQKPYDVFFKGAIPYNPKLWTRSEINPLEFNIGDLVRSEKKRDTFTKKAYNPTFSLTVHKIVDYNGRYVLDNGKEYHPEQLIKATEDNETLFKKIQKDNNNQMTKERVLKQDFKMQPDEIEKQILTTKRERKAPVRFY